MTDVAETGPYAIHVPRNALPIRTFLLGNRAGFVLYLPAEQRVRDATLVPIKWFGASSFGRTYLEENRVWIHLDDGAVKLDRTNQIGLTQDLDRAVRLYRVGDVEVRQTFSVPDDLRSFIMRLDAD